MISMYKWQQVKELNSRGVPIRRIAKDLTISRNTVRKYLRDHEPPTFSKRKTVTRILDRFSKPIEAMFGKRYIGTRIFNELKGLGYSGSQSTVDKYLNKLKEESEMDKRITTRFETEPGQQMQYDWKEWTLPI